MTYYKIARSFLIVLSFLLWKPLVAQVNTNVQALQFGDVQTGERDSLWLIISGPSEGKWEIENFFGPVFSISDSLPPANGSAPDSILVYFSPTQNLEYRGVLLIRHRQPFATDLLAVIQLSGNGRFNDPYYAATFNLSEEALKLKLKDLIDGHVSLGYNSARNEMFMKIDNKKVNGLGAAQNTLEGVYTGKEAVGYSSRSDAQNRFNFNTEHTYPQGQFNKSEPMRSDLHHLFPTKAYANSERSNKAFGIVTNPSWQEGGSKSNNNYFEPRDQQKGPTARAMLYFLIRYRNYNGYVSNSNQQLLIDWARNFEPTAVEKRRNEDIFKVQKNRNPFVDHPEFLERIHNFIGPSEAPENHSYGLSSEDLLLRISAAGSQQLFALANNGNVPVLISNVNTIGNRLQVDSFDAAAAPGEAAVFYLRWDTGSAVLSDTLLIRLDNGDLLQVPVSVALELGIEKAEAGNVSIYPVPASDYLEVRSRRPLERYLIAGADGKVLDSGLLSGLSGRISLRDLPQGFYLVRIGGRDFSFSRPLIIAR